MELGTMKDALERVFKKRRLCFSKSQEAIDQIGHETAKALAQITSKRFRPVAANMKAILTNLRSALHEIDPLDKLEGPQKDLDSAVSNCSRLLAKFFNPDISKAYRNVDLDFHILNRTIVTHFYQEGLYEIGDKMRFEAREADTTELKSHFKKLHSLLKAMKDKKLKPAINWACTNREKLRERNSNLEFKLKRQHFLKMLETEKQDDAFDFARTSILDCVSPHDPDFQELTSCIPWGRKIETSPCKKLLVHWETLPDELTREFCDILDLPPKNPLRVVISAGIQGLPTLLKLANVMAGKKEEWLAMRQLPVDLGKEFQFHSIFVCPVSREESSNENQAMLLPCFHILCRQSIIYLTRNNTFECPTPGCSSLACLEQCRELHF